MDVTVYTLEDANGNPEDYSTQDYREALEYAQKYHCRLIANTYEWTDSVMVDDYTASAS